MTEAAKETKTQKIERLKLEKNAWERLDEIREFARKGFYAIPPEWLSTYFRTWGIYTQGDGAGATGGKGGEGLAVPYFMVRIRIPNGMLSSHQARTIAALAQQARGLADITVRQNIQLHWVKVEELPGLIEQLWKAGLNTMGACGDVARNITGCPLSGVDADEVFDASPLALELNRFLVGNADFYNLPRKYKISVTGCRAWCSYPEINDIGLTGVVRKRAGREERGFSLRVGGGLSTQPHLGVRLNAFVGWDQAVPVVRAISEIFRGADALRQSREQARLKFLFLKQGWNAETFLAEINHRLGFSLDPAEEEMPPADIFRDHVGIHPQKQPGLCYVGAAVLRGRLTAEQLRLAADLADRFSATPDTIAASAGDHVGNGQMRTTTMQNLLIVNVPERNTEPLARELEAIGLRIEGSPFWRGAIACTGMEFCKLAITETKGFARWVVEELEERVPGFDQQLKLNITGCPNSCGQHWIADLGLEGKKIKVDGKLQDAYYFCVGGAVGREQSIARAVGYRCLASEVPDAAFARELQRAAQPRRELAAVLRPPWQRPDPRVSGRRADAAGCPRSANSRHATRDRGLTMKMNGTKTVTVGKVYLVGAGPGDPELLTVRAARLLARADVVLHDALVTREIMNLINPSALVINAGKRCGPKLLTQDDINHLLIAYAAEAKMVIRLKSGDPGILGRAGEEIEALAKAGVPFEIVPGITAASASASAAGISLTDRRFASSVLFTTAHCGKGADVVDPEWNKLVSSGSTLAVYMPGSDYGRLSESLCRAGLEPSTPCLVISRAGHPDQRLLRTDLARLASSEALPSPSLLIVGRCAGPLRETETLAHEGSKELTYGSQALYKQMFRSL